MLLKSLSIKNYKSLRDVTFTPSPISALVGPNSSGKTNFADAIEFLSEVYSLGLEMAIARKGGYENIAFRKQRRSKAPVGFEINLELERSDTHDHVFNSFWSLGHRPRSDTSEKLEKMFAHRTIIIKHKFSIVTREAGIKADFEVKEESFSILISDENRESEFLPLASVSKNEKNEIDVSTIKIKSVSSVFERLREYLLRNRAKPKQSLILKHIQHYLYDYGISALVSRFKVYSFSILHSRMPGVPTPTPQLSKSGENLPALVDWLQREHPDRWQIVMSGMKEILPTLNNISVQYLHTKTLGLFFDEEGFGRAWTIEDMSDGTVHALSMLVAAVDPRNNLLVIEEPENSVHPWILRVIVQKFREVSATKRIILTSHSPVLINLLKPEEIWITSRKDGETHLDRLIDLDPSVSESWRDGAYQIADLLDSGSIPQAVPGGVY